MVTAILVKLFTSVVASSSNPGRTGFLSGHKWEGLVATVQMDFLQPVDGYQLPANVHSFLPFSIWIPPTMLSNIKHGCQIK